MSRWFDILYRQKPVTGKGAVNGPSAHAPAPEVPSPSRMLTDEDCIGGSAIYEKPTALLSGIPNRWSLEIQKIVFHLRPEVRDESAPHHIVFSGMQKSSGTTTLSYLVAHHLATERNDQRVLYVDFNPSITASPPAGLDQAFLIGQEVPDDCFSDIRSTLTSLSIRPGGQHSVSVTSGWLNEFMAIAKRHFNWIIFDCPPFFTTPETYSAAKECDGVVLVLRSGETRHPAIKALVSDLESLGIVIIGTVLNFRQYPLPKWLLRYV